MSRMVNEKRIFAPSIFINRPAIYGCVHLLLLDNQDPLILDQPEDNLDFE
jgi:hypothetical protein